MNTQKIIIATLSDVLAQLADGYNVSREELASDFQQECRTTFGDASKTLITLEKFEGEIKQGNIHGTEGREEENEKALTLLLGELRNLQVEYIDLEN